MKDGVRLVVSDMDGTLLNGVGELDPLFFELHNQMKRDGVVFVAASGRQYYNLVKIFASIKDDIFFVAENGTYVAYKDEILLIDGISNDQVCLVIDKLRSVSGAYAVVCGKDRAYIERFSGVAFDDFEKHVAIHYDRYAVVDDLRRVEGDVFLKVAVYDTVGAHINSYAVLKDLGDVLQVVVSGNYWVDVSSHSANKSVGVSMVQRLLGVSECETMVFGDQMNDYEMMKRGYYSYAVSNAVEGVKEVAHFSTSSNVEGGVIAVLKAHLE